MLREPSKEVIELAHFYNTRDVPGAGWNGQPWPSPKVAENINTSELGNLRLTPDEEAAEAMVEAVPGRHRITVGGDKAYDTRGFVQSLRALNAVPHVAQNCQGRKSAIDGRTTRHPGYAVSQRLRKRVEEIFGWMKTVGNLRKTRHRGPSWLGIHSHRAGVQSGANPQPDGGYFFLNQSSYLKNDNSAGNRPSMEEAAQIFPRICPSWGTKIVL